MTPFVQDPDFTLWNGDALEVLKELPSESVDCCVTSPPYWGLRDYGTEGQIGLESTPAEFVQRMVDVFSEVRRVLADHGTCWVNLGDSYNSGSSGSLEGSTITGGQRNQSASNRSGRGMVVGLKPKDLVGIPWRVALALQDDGWYLRSDIIWAKPNPMPESVTDRPTKSHEYVFLLTKQPRYFFDQEAVREPASWARWGDQTTPKHAESNNGAWMKPRSKEELEAKADSGRNIRSVWEIVTQPYAEAHFATFPQELPRRCIKAGCPESVCRTCGKARERITQPTAEYAKFLGRGYTDHADDLGAGMMQNRGVNRQNEMVKAGVTSKQVETTGWSDCGHDNYRPGLVLDPFMGSGTTAYVARALGRSSVGIELNPDYAALCAKRMQQQSLFADAS